MLQYNAWKSTELYKIQIAIDLNIQKKYNKLLFVLFLDKCLL